MQPRDTTSVVRIRRPTSFDLGPLRALSLPGNAGTIVRLRRSSRVAGVSATRWPTSFSATVSREDSRRARSRSAVPQPVAGPTYGRRHPNTEARHDPLGSADNCESPGVKLLWVKDDTGNRRTRSRNRVVAVALAALVVGASQCWQAGHNRPTRQRGGRPAARACLRSVVLIPFVAGERSKVLTRPLYDGLVIASLQLLRRQPPVATELAGTTLGLGVRETSTAPYHAECYNTLCY